MHTQAGWSAVFAAVSEQRPEVVDFLVSEGADDTFNNESPLFKAARNGDIAVVKALIESGTTVNSKNDV